MDAQDALTTLQQYKDELEGILSRFQRTQSGLHSAEGDDARVHQIAIELRDFFNDLLGNNQYGPLVMGEYVQGISNFSGGSSYASVERIKGIVSSVITRVERNPELINKKPEQALTPGPSHKPLELPQKVTLRWLIDHAPLRLWVSLAGIVLTIAAVAFSLGITAVTKLSIVQEWTGVKIEVRQ